MSKKFQGNRDEIKESLRKIFNYLGENPDREGLVDTPERMIRSWDKIFGGYLQDASDVITTFTDKGDIPHNQIVLLKNIEFYSTCEHHFQPFSGVAHVAYIPNDKIVGISKLARLVEMFARRLQVQERVGNQVTETLMEQLQCKGAACVIEAKHFCMTSRGVEKQNSVMVTSSLTGCFLSDHKTRQELMTLIRS